MKAQFSAKFLQFILLPLFVFMLNVGWGQGSETFTNLPTTSSTNYLARSWTGDNGGTWTASSARTDQTITGKAIAWTAVGANVLSPSYSGGMGTLTFKYVRAFTGTGARSIEVYVNSVKIGSTITVSGTSDVVVTYSSAINVSGNVVLEIRNTGTNQVKVDDISWTAYSAATPTISAQTLGSALTTTVGLSSAAVQTTATGTNLTGSNNITITPQTNFEVSTTSATAGFSASAITGIANTGVSFWVRLASTAPVGTYNSATAAIITGGGASSGANVTTSALGNIVSPANDLCSSAINLTNGSATSGTTVSATYNTLTSEPYTANSDVWYTYTAIGSGIVTVTATNSATIDYDLFAYSTSCPTVATGIGSIPTGSTSNETMTFTATSGTTYYIRIVNSTNTTGSTFTITASQPVPTISTTGTLAAVTTTYGTASATPTSFNVSGANMTAGITVAPPVGFEVSTSSTFASSIGTNSSPITVGAAGTIASTPVYVRLASTTAVGTYSGNIVLSSTSATSVNVTTVSSTVSAKALTITGLSTANKNYDGNTNVSVTGTAAYSGLVNSESFTPADNVTWAFPDANVGANKVLTRTGSYSAPSSNYTVTQPSLTASIIAVVPTAPTITGITAGNAQLSVAFTAPSSNGGASITNYEYSTNGGSTFTALSPAQTTSPVVISSLTNGTTYTVQIRAVNSAGSGTASSSSSGTPEAPANPVITISASTFASAFSTTYGTASTVQSFTVSGAALTGDLSLTAPTGFEISLSNSTGFTSTLTFTPTSGSVSLTTVYVRLAATTAVGSFNGVVFTVSGGGAPSASISTTASANSVVQKALTISGLSSVNKSYDGNTNATLSGTAAYSGLANGETFVVVGSATATFASANASNGIAVSVSGFSAPSANYSITQPSFTANITAVNLTISGIAISNKVYNGNTTATITGSPAYQGLVNGETYTVTGTPSAVFASANAGSAISVTVSGYTAPSANYTVTQPFGLTADITLANQTITFNALANKTTADVPFALTATASSGLTVTYTSSNTSVATVSGSTVTIVGAGTTTITASQAGNGNYNAATSVSQILTVTYANIGLGNYLYTGTASASGPSSRLNAALLNLSGLNSNVSFSTQTLSGLTVQTGSTNDNLLAVAPASGNFGTTINTSNYVQFTVSPAVGYLLSVSSITFNNGRTSAGSTAWALRSSLDNYSTDITTGSTTSTSNPPTVLTTAAITGSSFSNLYEGITFRLYPYGGVSTGFWRIDNLTVNGFISLPQNSPTLTADATANTVDNNIDITFTEDATWRSAITALKIGTTTLTPTTDYIITAGNIQLKPSGLNTLLTVAGTKAITVIATGYSDATVSQVINAGVPTSNSTATISAILAAGATRTITCTAKDQFSNLVSGYTFKYDATIVALNATTSESYVIDGTTASSTLSDISLTATTNASGVATFTVQLPSLLDANDGISVQVQLADGSTNIGSAFTYYELPGQTITFNALNAVTYGDAAFTISASGGASGNPVVFTSSNNAVATCTGTNGTTVTIIGVGTATISANQAGSAGYNAAATVSQNLTVNQKALTISGITGANKIYNGTTAATFTGTPAYVGLVNGQSFSVSGTATAVFSDANAGTGKTITVTGYTAPSANYSLTQPILTADITQASQTITGFASLPNRAVGGPTFTLNAASATSATNPISYVSSNTSVATISGNTVTIVGAGSTTITASQAGNINYSAATSVAQIQTIIALPIAAWDFYGQTSPTSFAATTFNTNLDATSSLSAITRGAGAVIQSTPPGNSFSTTGFQNNGISTANTDYFQITLKGKTGYALSLSEINANFDGTSSFYATPGVTSQYAYSLDGTNFTLIGSPITSTSLKPDAVNLSGIADLQDVSSYTTVTIRYYASGQTTTGGWRLSSPSAGVLGLAIGGSLCQLPEQLLLSSTPFCNNGETSTISSTSSLVGVTYELYDGNGVVPNTLKPGTGNSLTWTGFLAGTYYVVGTREVGQCTSASANIALTAINPTYSYYIDTDGDGFGAGTAVLSCSATAPSNYSTLSTDCNDNNAAISPGTAEICGDGIDNNCDNNESYPSQYRSGVATGDWSDASTWEKYCNAGGSWTAAQIAPSNQYFNASNPFAVTVQSGHTVTVSTTSTTAFAKAGSLSVAGNLIVNGNLTVTSSVINSGNVTINPGASFVQTSENTTNTGSGNFVVNMNLSGTNNGAAPNGRYWYIGSPMNNTNIYNTFYNPTAMTRIWEYLPATNAWNAIINSSTGAGVNSTTTMAVGMGYLYRAGALQSVTYTGNAANFNNNIITPLSFTGAGYKYVANPYTSHVDWRLVTRTGLNVSYWIRNTTNTAYEAYNATSGVSTPSGTQTTQFIPPMQGFWIYAYTTPCSLRMDNGDRTHSTNLLHAPEHNQIVRLNLNNGKTDDQAVVYENDNASNGIEEYDTDKFMDENHHQVYFLEGTKQLTLDGLKDATAKQRVDMGIQITAAGTYTINATELGVEEDVMLEDKFTHTFQDLKRNSTYSFTSNAGTYNNRFVLHFTLNPQTETAMETVEVTETPEETEGVSVYTTTGQQVKVWVTNTTDFQNATVKVYDSVGNMIERKNMTSSELLLDLDTATGVYLVEVTGAEKTFTKKVFISK